MAFLPQKPKLKKPSLCPVLPKENPKRQVSSCLAIRGPLESSSTCGSGRLSFRKATLPMILRELAACCGAVQEAQRFPAISPGRLSAGLMPKEGAWLS